jgi:hypothetical protein
MQDFVESGTDTIALVIGGNNDAVGQKAVLGSQFSVLRKNTPSRWFAEH